MFALIKPDLRACTRLLSVAAAARCSSLLLLAACCSCWIWMLMEPALHLDLAVLCLPQAAATAADACHCCCTQLLCCLPCCAHCYLPCCALCCSPCVNQTATALGACQNCAARYLNFRPTSEEPGRKTKDTSRSVTCAATCLGYVSMCSRFWSRAKSNAVLGGTLGENAAWCSCHGSSTQTDGCGLSPAAGPAWHVVLCGHRSVFSSPPGEANVSPPRIFPRTLHL